VVREVEAIGGNVQASASREQMGYTFDALKTYVPEMVELLVDCVRNPAFLDWEVNEQVLSALIFLILSGGLPIYLDRKFEKQATKYNLKPVFFFFFNSKFETSVIIYTL